MVAALPWAWLEVLSCWSAGQNRGFLYVKNNMWNNTVMGGKLSELKLDFYSIKLCICAQQQVTMWNKGSSLICREKHQGGD